VLWEFSLTNMKSTKDVGKGRKNTKKVQKSTFESLKSLKRVLNILPKYYPFTCNTEIGSTPEGFMDCEVLCFHTHQHNPTIIVHIWKVTIRVQISDSPR